MVHVKLYQLITDIAFNMSLAVDAINYDTTSIFYVPVIRQYLVISSNSLLITYLLYNRTSSKSGVR